MNVDKISRKTQGPRFETGRFEAFIYPYNYPEELGAIPDFDRTSNSLPLPLSSLRGRTMGEFRQF